jgi:hypothetical protein
LWIIDNGPFVAWILSLTSTRPPPDVSLTVIILLTGNYDP